MAKMKLFRLRSTSEILSARKVSTSGVDPQSAWRRSKRVRRALINVVLLQPTTPGTLCSSTCPRDRLVLDYPLSFSWNARAARRISEHVVTFRRRRLCVRTPTDLSLPRPTHSEGSIRERRSDCFKPTEASQDEPSGPCLARNGISTKFEARQERAH
jgi:hypothetical protein